MKKIIFYVTLLAMLFIIFSGCSGKTSSDNFTSDKPTVSKSSSNKSSVSVEDDGFSSTKPEMVVASDPDVFTIQVFSTLKGSVNGFQFKTAVEAKYKEKYPKATIQWNEQEADQWFRSHDKLAAEFTEKRAEDVIFYSEDASLFVKDGYLLDLSDQPWVPNLRSNIAESLSYNGKVYGGSLGIYTIGVWYNKDIFSKLELKAPKTWSDFIALCAKLKANGIPPLTAVGIDQGAAIVLFGVIALTAETVSNPDFELNLHEGKGKVNGPEYQGVLKKILELAQNGVFYADPLGSRETATKAFLAGKVAMTIDGSQLPAMRDGLYGPSNINMGFFPLPDENGNAVLHAAQGYKVFINSNSKLIRQSKDLVALFMTKEMTSIFAKETGYYPVSIGVTVDYPHPEQKEALQWINQTPGSVINLWRQYLPYSTILSISDAVIKVIDSKQFTGKELDDAQKKFDQDKDTVKLPVLR